MADLAKAATYQTTEDAVTLSGRIRRRELSAQAAVGEALDRIHALNGTLAAFCTLGVDQAMAQAEAVDKRLAAGESVGALAGVPVAIKDLISTRGLRTTFGSPLYSDNVPDEDDIAVERLRAAGAIVVGKTNTSEFGYGAGRFQRRFSLGCGGGHAANCARQRWWWINSRAGRPDRNIRHQAKLGPRAGVPGMP